MTTMRECRLTYVNAILTKKEQLKGQLQNMVNETITNIKELKVDQELNDAGLPSNEPGSAIETAIQAELDAFSTAVSTFVADEFDTFYAAGGPGDTIDVCLNDAETAFNNAYSFQPTVGDPTGALPQVETLADACTAELDAFATKVDEVLNEQIMEYTEDAEKQKNIVATDFFDVLETTLYKIHDGLTDLDDTERQTLTDAMMTERDNFGTDVSTWSTEFSTLAMNIATDLAAEFSTKSGEFDTDINTTLTEWLADYYADLQGLIAQKKTDEGSLADQQISEMNTWLTSHVSDLETALQEVC